MRSFVAVVAVAAIIGIVAGERAAQAVAAPIAPPSQPTALDAISDIASAPLKQILPEPPPAPPKPPVNLADVQFKGVLTAPHVIVVDGVSDAVLFQKNAQEAQPLASISKLMTALILTEKISNWSATTTIMTADIRDNSQVLQAGEVYTLHDLFRAGLVGSLNTAMNALVRATGMSEAQFAILMNQRAADLNMPSLHFEDQTGLSAHNVGSAKDVARLIKIAFSSAQIKVTSVSERVVIREIKTNKNKVVKPTDWILTDAVPLHDASIEGGKTGYIDESGYNFASQIKGKGGHEIRVVVLGAADVYKRFTETAALAEWTFKNFVWP